MAFFIAIVVGVTVFEVVRLVCKTIIRLNDKNSKEDL